MGGWSGVALRVVLGFVLAAQWAWAAGGSDGIWNEIREPDIRRNSLQRQIVPAHYKTYLLDRSLLTALLEAAPIESVRRAVDSPVQLALPLPDGSFSQFTIVESPVMEPDLAAKYPRIKTYLGQGVDDPTATLRFDLTPKGFHAQIISADGTIYIDPFQPDDLEHYIAYRKHDHHHGERGICEVTGEPIISKSTAPTTKVSSGANLRTYRLAMAATGEYTAFHGGTVVDGLAGIVTTLNRVNGIYEREVSVRMVLVGNNDSIIFTNGATDPYTNDDGFAMLGENQTRLTMAIGNANYDVGHVVSTGGGGVASLRSPCRTSDKAQGVTGSPSPVGDAFDVDYVAHEMGHQFGGNHTFNGSGVNCSGGNRNSATAYEPGSGITIQAYAGICGADNLQPNSEDYFHRVSLNEILAFTTNATTGASCGTLTATGNTVPTVTPQAAKTIPGRTPFTLTATGSSGDGDALTYLWEQFDLGAANAAGVLVGTLTTGPIFRSYTPTTSGSRTFPSWRYILNDANVPPALTGGFMTGEILSNADRTLNFRVTVRDNRAGGGGTNEATTVITVDKDAGPFAITAPNTAVSLAAGAATTVTWNVANTTAAPVSTANVRITLSTDGGITYPIELLASTPNDGTQSVTLPADVVATMQARMRVEAVGNIYFDVSDANFTITRVGNTPPGINVTGSVTTRQGSPTTSAVVATLSDAQDSAGSLFVSVEDAPPELLVSATNAGGNVTLNATASCTLVAPGGTRTYPVVLRVTDSGGAQSTAIANVLVSRNLVPTLGAYANQAVNRNSSTAVSPAAAPADGNNNLATPTISPTTLPGGGTVSIAANGTATIATTASTTLGAHTIRASANDTCGAVDIQQFTVTVGATILPGVTITPSGGSTSVIEDGATDTYTVVLNSVPSASVTVAISPDAQVTTSGNLTFTTTDWNSPQTVIVTAVNDAVVEGAHSGTITHSASGGGYTGSTIANITADITDNDTAGVTVTPSGGNTNVVESGPIDSYTVVLTAQPSASVTVALTPDAQVTTSSNLTFTPGNWNTAQTVNVTAVNDTVVEASHTGTITHSASGGGYTGVGIASVVANITDNDVGGVTITQSGGSTDVTEAGATDSYTVVLTAQPSTSVSIALSPDAQVTTSGNLTFTTANWNTAQTVTVTAVNDAIVEAAHTGTIAHSASGGGYTGVSIGNVIANITDNDTGGVAITQSGGSADVTEGGTTDSYMIVLTTQPSADVTIALSPDAQVTTSGNLTFTTANWNIARSVTVAAVDDTAIEGTHTGTITHSASGGGYTGASVANVVVNITDDDTGGVIITQSGGSTDVTEGSATDSYTLVLTAQPSASVSVTISPDAQVTTSGNLTFTTANWNTAQTVTVTAVNDALVEGAHVGTIMHSASGGGYTGVSIANVVANITDSNNGGVTITPSGGSTDVTEDGTTDSYAVVLTAQPSASVTVAISPDAQVTTTADLTFTTVNWNIAQTVTVTAINDPVLEGAHTGTITHSASGGGYNGVSVANVVANITDNDNAGVAITQSGGRTDVTEGGATDTYTVVLTAQPNASVTVALSPDAQVTTSGNLTFTTANWNIAQTVTVTAANDAVVEGAHAGTITHSASGGGYTGVSIANVIANITDNDTGGVLRLPSDGSNDVTEGGAADSYAVVLTAQPSASVTVSISPDAQVTTSGNLTFTTANWNTFQIVTVTAVDDVAIEGPHTGTITHSASGGGYTGVGIANVVVNITDNDAGSVSVAQSGGSTDVTEGGATDSYTLVLTTQPSADVIVTVTPDAQVATSANLTFTTANWNIAQTVTATAVNDAVFEGAHVGTISHSASGGGYTGVAIASVTVNITDNDATPVDLGVLSQSLRVPVAGERMSWEVAVDNLTATDVTTATFEFSLPPALTNVSWLCVADGDASCPAGGTGAPLHSIVLGGNAGVLYRIGADVPAGTAIGSDLVTAATIAVTTPYIDTVSANDSDSTVDTVGEPRIFKDGFETPP